MSRGGGFGCVSRLLSSSGRWMHDVSVWTGFSLCPYYCYHGVSTPSLVVLNLNG